MSVSGAHADLLAALETLDGLGRRLEAVLELERATLRQRDAAALERIVAEKSALVSEIEQATGVLMQTLRDRGASADRHGLESCLDTPALRRAWDRLQGVAAACQADNRTNGALIEAGRSFSTAFLNVLRGSGGGTYDRGGRLSAGAPARAIASA